MIPQSFIQELLSRTDVVDVVGRYVKLKKGGANFLGLCPFHDEKSPSFTVSPSKQFFHCFGCGAHGTAVGFLMDYAGMSYVDAIHDLARAAGLDVPEERANAEQQARRDPDVLEVLATAARFYRRRLKDSPHAIEYLKRRGLTGETAARFAIGYAPEGWRGLEAAVADYAAPALVSSGLVIETDDEDRGHRRYDRFRDRIMFPILNSRGQVIGFGGRVLDQGEPKYLNSPETPVFSKGRELYGLFEARDAMRGENCAIVVEGYMDVVMLAQHGVGNAVATLGTATTADHVRKLIRLVDRVVFAFDGDAAGRKAAWRALEAALPHAGDTKRIDFLFLPAGHDPDSFVREVGADGLRAALARTLPLSEFLQRELGGRCELETPEGRASFLAQARPLVRLLPLAALRIQIVHALARLAGIEVHEFERFLAGDDGEPRRPPAARPADGWRGESAPPGGWQGPREKGRSPSARPFPGGRGGGRDTRRQGAGPQQPAASAVRSAAAPDLTRHVRLLTALHPGLVLEPIDPSYLPVELVEWFTFLGGLPAGASLAAVLEGLRATDPERARQLQRDASVESVVADLTLAEARPQLEDALQRLRERAAREESGRLAAKGLDSEDDRRKMLDLIAAKRMSA